MSIVTHEQFKQFIDDSKWLQKNYNELIKEFNLEYIAIINHKVVAHHKEMNEFERELKQSNLPILDVVVEFIRDKCMQLLYSLYI
jgi:predicted house-cleaning noncanonical NTP pyrophosphatase (MazG superfamily)